MLKQFLEPFILDEEDWSGNWLFEEPEFTYCFLIIVGGLTFGYFAFQLFRLITWMV